MSPAVEQRRGHSRKSPRRSSDSPAEERGSPPPQQRRKSDDRPRRYWSSADAGRSPPRKRSPVIPSSASRGRSPKPARRERSPSDSPPPASSASRGRSPKHAARRDRSSGSPPPPSPSLARGRSLKHVRDRSPAGLPPPPNLTSRGRSPKYARRDRSPSGSPSPRPRGRSPKQSRRDISPSASPPPQLPRTKWLKRAEAEREGRHRGRNRDDMNRRAEFDKEWKNSGNSERYGGRNRLASSPTEHRHRGRRDSQSRSPPRALRDERRDEVEKSSTAMGSRGSDDDAVAKMNAAAEALEAKEKQKPSFELSGKLAEETNRVRGVTLLHSEPPEARKPDIRWRLYVFKNGEVLNEPLYVHRMSSYLFGRERKVADIPTDHPSCSKQHAVLQFRLVEKEQDDGMMSKEVRPYVMDLNSTNGTFINDNRIEPRRYYELFEKDTVRFGNSSREYVLLHENSIG